MRRMILSTTVAALSAAGCSAVPITSGPSRADLVAALADYLQVNARAQGQDPKDMCLGLAFVGGRDGVVSLIESQPDKVPGGLDTTDPDELAKLEPVLARHGVTVGDYRELAGDRHEAATVIADAAMAACVANS